jgi:hypothetical protein
MEQPQQQLCARILRHTALLPHRCSSLLRHEALRSRHALRSACEGRAGGRRWLGAGGSLLPRLQCRQVPRGAAQALPTGAASGTEPAAVVVGPVAGPTRSSGVGRAPLMSATRHAAAADRDQASRKARAPDHSTRGVLLQLRWLAGRVVTSAEEVVLPRRSGHMSSLYPAVGMLRRP